MISVSKFFCFLVLFSSCVCAASLDSGQVRSKLEGQYLASIVREYPYLSTKDVRVFFKTPDAFKIPTSATQFRLEMADSAHVLGKTVIPLVYLNSSLEPVSSIKLAVEVIAYAPFVIARREIARNAVVTEDDINMVVLSVDRADRSSYRTLSEVVGKLSLGTVVSGTVLSSRMFKPVPVIFKDTDVMMLFPRSEFSLEVKGRALEDGGVGDMIRVQSSVDSRKIFRGKVKDDKTVIMHTL